jgi:hypothetical protein
MARHRVLYLSSGQLTVYHAHAGTVTEQARFSSTVDGLAAFAAFLRQEGACLYLMLCDLADEAFIAEKVPAVRGSDRRALLRRKLGQHFFDTPLTCVRSRGRARTGRRDEQIVFCALTRPATLEPWLAALRAAHAPLRGIYSTALVGESLLERLRIAHGTTLLLTIAHTGIRQSFFEDGRLYFSRLTPPGALSDPDLPRACTEEARRLYPYLLSQRLATRDTPLKVRILVPPAHLDAFAHACRCSDTLQFELIDSHQAACRLGLRPSPDAQQSETLLVQALMRQPPAGQFAPPAERRAFRIRQIRFALLAAGGIVLAGCLAMTMHTVLNSIALRNDSARLMDRAADAERIRQDIIARLPPTPVPLETLRVVHERSLQLERRSALPAGLLRHLGRVLEHHPEVTLERLDWKLASPTAPRADAPPPIEAQLLIQARLPAEYIAQQQHALERVDALADDLRRAPGTHVHIEQPPFTLDSGQALRGGIHTGRNDTGSTPRFSLRISRALAP